MEVKLYKCSLWKKCFLVLLDIEASHQEIQKCIGDMVVCSQNSANLSKFYINSASNDSNTTNIARKNISHVHKRRKNSDRRKNFRRKVHRYSTRVLTLKPAIILLPPFENDIQERNVSTLNPFIINILASLKNSTENFDFVKLSPKRLRKPSNKSVQSVAPVSESDQNPKSMHDAKVASFGKHVQTQVIVPPQQNSSFSEVKHTLGNAEIEGKPFNDSGLINTPPPPFPYLLPPFLEEINNVLDSLQLENSDLPADNYFKTSSPFFRQRLPESSSFPTSLAIGDTVSMEQFNHTISYNNYSFFPVETTIQPVADCINNTKVANSNCSLDKQFQESNSHNFSNTLLTPEIASLGMKIVTSKKGLEMIKELSDSRSSSEHPHYEESHSTLETAESGDIRLHTFNQILSIEDAKEVSKNMYKALKKPNKPFELCNLNQGYVADPSSGCQVFYICFESGAGEPMMCPNGTLFNQEVLVCDWWYNVECSG